MGHLRTAALAVLACFAGLAAAEDLGVHGKVWQVTERDFREEFVRAAGKVDWAKVAQGLEEDTHRWLANQPVYPFGPASQSRVTWLDLTYTLEADMQVPEFDELTGTYSWRVLYPRGTKVNPLDHLRPSDALVFFDSRDEGQVAFVKALVAKAPFRWMLIQTAGNPATSSEKIGRPVFHSQPALTDRFQIRQVPSIVFAGHGDRSRLYGVATVAHPYAPEEAALIERMAFPDAFPAQGPDKEVAQ